MEDAGTVDLRGDELLPLALRCSARPKDPQLRGRRLEAARLGHGRRAPASTATSDGTLRALGGDPDPRRVVAAVVEAEFEPGSAELFDAVQSICRSTTRPNNHGATSARPTRTAGTATRRRTCARCCGADGARALLARVLRRRARSCRARLVASLQGAIAQDAAAKLYGGDPVCARPRRDGDERCYDAVMMRPLGGGHAAAIHWINRPTFQQVGGDAGPPLVALALGPRALDRIASPSFSARHEEPTRAMSRTCSTTSRRSARARRAVRAHAGRHRGDRPSAAVRAGAGAAVAAAGARGGRPGVAPLHGRLVLVERAARALAGGARGARVAVSRARATR